MARPDACLTLDLLRFVRDAKPTEAELLEWLGSSRAGCYWVLRQAGLLQIRAGAISLSSECLSDDGQRFRYGNRLFHLDENRIDHHDEPVEL
jgi:hypothetical protein